MVFERIKELLLFFWPLIVAILGPIISTVLYAALRRSKKLYRLGTVLVCSIVVCLVLIFFPIGKRKRPEIKVVKQPQKMGDSLIFDGRISNYNPYRIITYFEKFSDPGKLCIAYPDRAASKWPIGSEGSWTVKITPVTDIKTVYFFLVRESYPAPDYVPNFEKIDCAHCIRWGIGELMDER